MHKATAAFPTWCRFEPPSRNGRFQKVASADGRVYLVDHLNQTHMPMDELTPAAAPTWTDGPEGADAAAQPMALSPVSSEERQGGESESSSRGVSRSRSPPRSPRRARGGFRPRGGRDRRRPSKDSNATSLVTSLVSEADFQYVPFLVEEVRDLKCRLDRAEQKFADDLLAVEAVVEWLRGRVEHTQRQSERALLHVQEARRRGDPPPSPNRSPPPSAEAASATQLLNWTQQAARNLMS